MMGGREGHVGGVERQTSLMAKWLARRGYRMSLLTWADGPQGDELIDGVRVIKICPRDAGISGIRFFYPRWTSLLSAMKRADADLYYHNAAEYVTGQVGGWCRSHQRKFVFSSASDMDCEKSLAWMDGWRVRTLYRRGLRLADRLIVQTNRQQRMIRENYGLESEVIPMPCVGPKNGVFVPPSPPKKGQARVAWVGRIVPVKRLEMLLDVAEMVPEVIFEIAGPQDGETEYAAALIKRASSLSNVQLLGRVDRGDMPALYQRVDALCCTSSMEGFPNTFLEAWSFGVPVVSTFDPDDLIASRELGRAVGNASGVAEWLRRLFEDSARWRAASDNGRRYYLEHHIVDHVMHRFEGMFLDVLGHCPVGDHPLAEAGGEKCADELVGVKS
jgi:glycosyltransferase involved in cell wall biosynthesis